MVITESAKWMRDASTVVNDIIQSGAFDGSIWPSVSYDAAHGVVRIDMRDYADATGLARGLGLDLHTSKPAGALGNRHEWAGEEKGVKFLLGAFDHARIAVAS